MGRLGITLYEKPLKELELFSWEIEVSGGHACCHQKHEGFSSQSRIKLAFCVCDFGLGRGKVDSMEESYRETVFSSQAIIFHQCKLHKEEVSHLKDVERFLPAVFIHNPSWSKI